MFGATTGILASRNRVTVAASQFYTSVLFPIVWDESIGVNPLAIENIQLIKEYAESLTTGPLVALSGTLETTIAYVVYDNAALESIAVGPLSFGTGANGAGESTLTTTIAYVSYDNAVLESIAVGPLTSLSGTLATTISYVTYDNAITEAIAVGPLTSLSGTLT